MVVSRCRGVVPPSGIVLGTLFLLAADPRPSSIYRHLGLTRVSNPGRGQGDQARVASRRSVFRPCCFKAFEDFERDFRAIPVEKFAT